MRCTLILVLVTLLGFLVETGVAQTIQTSPSGPSLEGTLQPRPPSVQLDYAESSTGLSYPDWEGGSTELEMGDVNGDGFVDIVSIGDHGSPYVNTQEHGVMVYFGDGQGSWTVSMSGNFGYGGVALGDVNNDGFVDVGYGMHHDYSSTDFGDQLIEVALGDGTGMNWTPWDDGLATNGESWGMFGTDFADIDGDGDLDLGSASFGSGSGVHVYANNGDGTWTQTFGFLSGNCNLDFIFGDVNNDGNPDFAAEHQGGTVYLGDGSGGFTLADNNLPSPGGYGARDGVDLGDLNNDGYDDIAWIDLNGGAEVWLWAPSGTWVEATGGLPASGPAEAAQIADMDGDGNKDLALFGNGVGGVYLGDGTGHWSLNAVFTIAGSPGYSQAFRAGEDVDRNGRGDIVLLDEEGTWINYENHLRCFRETSTPGKLGVRLTRPGPHKVWKRGSVRFVEWLSSVPGAAASAIDLDISTSGPQGPWTSIAGSLPDNGRHQMIVPAGLPQSAECHLRITVKSGSDEAEFVNAIAFVIE
jgi:hypothetical protein